MEYFSTINWFQKIRRTFGAGSSKTKKKDTFPRDMLKKLKKYSSFTITLVEILADFLSIFGSLMLGYVLYHYLYNVANIGTGPKSFSPYFKLALGVSIFFIVLFERVGLYKRQMSILNIEEIKGIFKAVLLGFVVLLVANFYIRQSSFSRLIISYSLIIMLIFVNVERLFFFKLHQRFHMKGSGVQRVLIYGAGEVGKLLYRRMLQSPHIGYLPVGFMDDNKSTVGAEIPIGTHYHNHGGLLLGRFEDLEEVFRKEKIDEVFIAMPSVAQEQIQKIIRKCRELKVKFRFVPSMFDIRIQKVGFATVGGIPLLSTKEYRSNRITLFFKRLLDVFFSGLVLLLFSPLLAIIALLIKKDSPGPVIFKQKRVGKGGKEFVMYKFRSMYVETPPYKINPLSKDDPRITRVGKFLRRTSLDELPQFWDVFKGDMSVVGPRPEMPFIVETYNDIHRERLAVKPGVTGLWQVSADRAGPIHENMDYDLYYIENMSILLDLVIILRTIWFAIRGIGAV